MAMSDSDTYNIWNKWDPLKAIMLGNTYDSSFYKDIKNDRIRSALMRIADETIEDLDNFEQVLKSFGCKVLRSKLESSSIMEYADENGEITGTISMPPLTPRDRQLVLGNIMYLKTASTIDAEQEMLKAYRNEFSYLYDIPTNMRASIRGMDYPYFEYFKNEMQLKHGYDIGTFNNYVNDDLFCKCLPPHIRDEYLSYNHTLKLNRVEPPSITIVGKDVYVDEMNLDNKPIPVQLFDFQKNIIEENQPFRVNVVKIGGHNDGCFHTIKPGAILSLKDIQTYEKTFPGWDVCYLENQSWNLVDGFMQMKDKVQGRWWVAGEEGNDEFIHFVETWLHDWVGYVEESVFDVNVVMLDQKHVCVSNYNDIAFEFFKKHGIEPIIVPWRHRYFWDGGLHCITLDLHREGHMEDFFPGRSSPIHDQGF